MYNDVNNNDAVDGGDVLIQTETADAMGDYTFEIATTGNFVITIPSGNYTFTTDSVLQVDLNNIGKTVSDRNIGITCGDPTALNDTGTTPNNINLTVTVLANDTGTPCFDLDASSVSTSGLIGPLFGTAAVQGNGSIIYTPDQTSEGVDSFQYLVCDDATTPQCDTAWVFITLTCAAVTDTNRISGKVFEDLDEDGLVSTGDLNTSGVTVYLFEDDTPNDSIADGVAIDSTTTGVSGNYSFSLSNSYGTSGAYKGTIAIDADDARQKPDNNVEDDKNELKLGKEDIIGIRYTGLNIPSNATIDTALVTFTAKKNGKTTSVNIVGEDNDLALPFVESSNNLSNRSQTAANVSWNMPAFSNGSSYTAPDIKTIIQEIVDDNGGLTNLVLLFEPTGSDDNQAHSRDNDPNKAPTIYVAYTVAGQGSYNYIITIDTSTLPSYGHFTTDSVQIASFTQATQSDCSNNFGFVRAPEVCDNGLDDDADGLIDCHDSACSTLQICDKDGDGIANVEDRDDDNDGILDIEEWFCPVGNIDAQNPNPLITVDHGKFDITYTESGTASALTVTGPGSLVGILPLAGNIMTYEFSPDLIDLVFWIADLDAREWVHINFYDSAGTRLPDLVPYITVDSAGTASHTVSSTPSYGLDIDVTATSGASSLANHIEITMPFEISKIVLEFDALNSLGGVATGTPEYYISAACATIDSDGDGVADYVDLDSDNDGLFDAVEAGHDDSHGYGFLTSGVDMYGIPLSVSDGSGSVDYTVRDSDSDGDNDSIEVDSDGDLCKDTREEGTTDLDHDGRVGNGTPTVDTCGRVSTLTYIDPPDLNWRYDTIMICERTITTNLFIPMKILNK